jgi:hypothetical protein
MAWRTNSPPRESEVVSIKEAVTARLVSWRQYSFGLVHQPSRLYLARRSKKREYLTVSRQFGERSDERSSWPSRQQRQCHAFKYRRRLRTRSRRQFFSTGMDTLAVELNRITPVGCHFTVRGGNDPRLEEATITSDLLSALTKGATVIYIGHSLGADSALRFAQAAHNFKLPLICPSDPVSWDSNAQQVVPGRWEVGSNVERVIGYRTNAFPGGGRIVLAAGNTVTNLADTTLGVPQASPPGGLDIASSPEVHATIVAGIRDVVARMQTIA